MKRPGRIALLMVILFYFSLICVMPVQAQEDEPLDDTLPVEDSMPADSSMGETTSESAPADAGIVDEPPAAMPRMSYKPGKKMIVDGIVQTAVKEDDGRRVRIDLQCPADNTIYVLIAEGNNRGLAEMAGTSVQVEGKFLQEENGKPVMALTSYQVNLPPDNSPTPPPPPEEPEYTEPPTDGGDSPPPAEEGDSPSPVDDEG